MTTRDKLTFVLDAAGALSFYLVPLVWVVVGTVKDIRNEVRQ